MEKYPLYITSTSGIASKTGVTHSTVPAPSTATEESKTPAPTAAATWSWLTEITWQSGESPISSAADSRIFPASVPVGTGADIFDTSISAASKISRLQVRDEMSKAMVRVARE